MASVAVELVVRRPIHSAHVVVLLLNVTLSSSCCARCIEVQQILCRDAGKAHGVWDFAKQSARRRIGDWSSSGRREELEVGRVAELGVAVCGNEVLEAFIDITH